MRPTDLAEAQESAIEAGRAAFAAKIEALDKVRDEEGGYGDRLLRYVMLNVLDEKWKDHLYDLDQLRNAIHYRVVGAEGPAARVQAGGVHDVRGPDERRRGDVHRPVPQGAAGLEQTGRQATGGVPGQRTDARSSSPPRPTRRYNALGMLEDVPDETAEVIADVGRRRPASRRRRRPGPARRRSWARVDPQPGARRGPVRRVGRPRNNACPCGSGKKFKKCHGANL